MYDYNKGQVLERSYNTTPVNLGTLSFLELFERITFIKLPFKDD